MDYETAGDGALVAEIGRWKDAALAEVFRRHSGAVHGLARRVLGSANLAEDCLLYTSLPARQFISRRRLVTGRRG